MTANEKFSQAEKNMARQRQLLLAKLEPCTPEQIDFKPSASAWSVGETAHHLYLSERLIQENIRELLAAPGGVMTKRVPYERLPIVPEMIPREIFELAPFQFAFSMLRNYTPAPIQSVLLANPWVRIRTAPILEPKPGIPKVELIQMLKDARRDSLAMLEPGRSRDLSRLRWEHPVVGSFNIYESMQFISEHDHRHRLQMEEIMKNRSYPRGA